jgi:hypothetical protein
LLATNKPLPNASSNSKVQRHRKPGWPGRGGVAERSREDEAGSKAAIKNREKYYWLNC